MLFDNNRAADAMIIFKLNVEEYPNTASVYNNLADAYGRQGQKQLAIETYRKAAEIDANNQRAKDKLKGPKENQLLFREAAIYCASRGIKASCSDSWEGWAMTGLLRIAAPWGCAFEYR